MTQRSLLNVPAGTRRNATWLPSGDHVGLPSANALRLAEWCETRHEVARVQASEMILQQVQVLDQQVGLPGSPAEQRLNLVEREFASAASVRPSFGGTV